MVEEHLAWNVCSTATVTVGRNYYMTAIPHGKTAATFVETLWSSGNRCSYARQFATYVSHSSFLRSAKEDIRRRRSRSRYLLSKRTYDSKRILHHSDTATNEPTGQNFALLPEDRLLLPTESQTYKLGRLLGRDCRAGDVILLFGDLGVGKTVLARGYIHSAHSDNSVAVTSPSYLLMNSYVAPEGVPGVPEILHMDLWRLNDASQRPIVDFEKAFDQTACLIEWPDRLKSITPLTRLEVYMSYIDEKTGATPLDDDPWGFGADDSFESHEQRGRYVSLQAHGKKWNERIQNIVEEFSATNATEVREND